MYFQINRILRIGGWLEAFRNNLVPVLIYYKTIFEPSTGTLADEYLEGIINRHG